MRIRGGIDLLAVVFTNVLVVSNVFSIINPDQAKEAVRVFEGTVAIEFSQVVLQEESDGPEWTQRQYYSLEDRDRVRDWMVNANSGEVFWARYDQAYPAEPSDTPLGPLTQEQCRSNALSFAESRYQGFATMNLQLHLQEWTGYGWHFEWVETTAAGALTPNYVSVCINPGDGTVQSFASWRMETPTHAQPEVTASECVDIAKRATGIVTVQEMVGPTLFVEPEALLWDLELSGQDQNGKYLSYSVAIDAVSGDVLELSGSWAANPSEARNKQPRLAWIKARDELEARGYGISWQSSVKHLCAKRGKCTVVLPAGGEYVLINGERIQLPAPTKIIAGRMHVPAVFRDLLP